MSQNIDLGLIRKQQEDDLKKFQLESRRATQQQQAQDMSRIRKQRIGDKKQHYDGIVGQALWPARTS